MDSFIFREEYLLDAEARFTSDKQVYGYIYVLVSCVFDGLDPCDSTIPTEYRDLLAKHLTRIRADQERYLKRKARKHG